MIRRIIFVREIKKKAGTLNTYTSSRSFSFSCLRKWNFNWYCLISNHMNKLRTVQ